MSDAPQTPDWWQASDGKWYPPEQRPAPPTAPPPPGTPQPQGPALVDTPRSRPAARWLLAAGAALVILGAPLPWAEVSAPFVGTLTKSGTEGDGVITLILGFALVGLGAPAIFGGKRLKIGLGLGALVVAVLVLLVAVVDIVDVQDIVNDIEAEGAVATASVGIGLWLTAIGGALAFAGAAVALVKRSAD